MIPFNYFVWGLGAWGEVYENVYNKIKSILDLSVKNSSWILLLIKSRFYAFFAGPGGGGFTMHPRSKSNPVYMHSHSCKLLHIINLNNQNLFQ